ncbi:MAG: hypothetical protein AB7G44_09305 [Bacteroidia bacterium]
MLKAYNLKSEVDWDDGLLYHNGLNLYEAQKKEVQKSLDKFLLKDGSLNGSLMQSDWFPQINADIFISHSHKDEAKAIALAYWLKDNFGINTFIDSCLWSYSIDLLREIDNKYCLNSDGHYYSYQKRNFSTSHVHMMLSTALMMMIDKTECIFFLNTPNSITTDGVINQTESPWIYSEITMSKLVRRKNLNEYRHERFKAFSGTEELSESLKIKYDITTEHLTDITDADLATWKREWNKVSLHTKYPLDKLYELSLGLKIL